MACIKDFTQFTKYVHTPSITNGKVELINQECIKWTLKLKHH